MHRLDEGQRFVILATGLTPAWQKILVFPQFHRGEVNRARTIVACASGKVLNVGCALHHLGVTSKTLCPVGGDVAGQIRKDFEHLAIPVRWLNSRAPTRTCTTILDESDGATTELVENSAAIPADELDEYYDAFCFETRNADVVVFSGSLPQGTPACYVLRLLEQTHARAVLDIRGPELDEALKIKPFLVKPNREELAKTVGRALTSERELIEAMSELKSRGAEWVVVSQGDGPLVAVGPTGVLHVEPQRVPVRNPIGCGDCLAAGIAAGIDRGLPVPAALEVGMRAAAENASELLPARRLSRIA